MDRALLIGVSDYRHTKPPHGVPGEPPAVGNNVGVLREALVRGRVFADEDITALRSPDLAEAGRALQRVAREARGLLLVYFAGHGAIPSGGDELYLQMRDAEVFAGEHTVFSGAVKFGDLMATVLATSRAERIVVILDCCFAGNAARVWEHFEDKRRVVLLMSVQANHRIDAGDPRTPTPFTQNLAELLGEAAARPSPGSRPGCGGAWPSSTAAPCATNPGSRSCAPTRAPTCGSAGATVRAGNRTTTDRGRRSPALPSRRSRCRPSGRGACWCAGCAAGDAACAAGCGRGGARVIPRGRPAACCSGSPCRCCSPSACSASACTGRWA